MCGIAGVFNLKARPPVPRAALERMIAPVEHRGPDGFGLYLDPLVGLAHARLSIIDLEGGWQPIHNEDRSLWIVLNGEIFNYIELRKELEARGHRFHTESDTEVVIHLYEESGADCLKDLNGQFAFAIYDRRDRSLFLARDRLGIRPLYHVEHGGRFYFASEVKSLFAADPGIRREIDPEVLGEIFTFWTPCGEETIFRGVRQLLPGHWARVRPGRELQSREYWDVPVAGPSRGERGSEDGYAEQLRELLVDAVRLRLRADVPVGAYLSGGLDSSAIVALVRRYTDNPLKTFSVAFSDRVYDETDHQQRVVRHLDTDHHVVTCGYRTIAESFPDVIWHAETPILRTAPTPLMLLSGLVRKHAYKVVLTGEGADEVLGGYDIFKEAKIRAFIAKDPGSVFRPLLLKRLYPYLALSPARSAAYARKFFATDASLDDPFYAHRPRWKTTGRAKLFFSDALSHSLEGVDPVAKLEGRIARRLVDTDYLTRAQYLETRLLLANYLLSSQGDRMTMANSVEGRYPFLDHRVVSFAFSVPPRLRLKALDEKHVLKRAVADLLPEDTVARKKQPYMAPDILSFFGEASPEYLDHYLSRELVEEAGLFRYEALQRLMDKCARGRRQGFSENMAFVGMLSTQILYDRFCRRSPASEHEPLSGVRVMA